MSILLDIFCNQNCALLVLIHQTCNKLDLNDEKWYSVYDGCTQWEYYEPAAMLLLSCNCGNDECVVFDIKKNDNDNNRNSNKSNNDNNNYQLDMSSVIFGCVDHFMDSSANNYENIDVGDIAIMIWCVLVAVM